VIASLASSVSGEASLECNTTSGACTMQITGLPVQQIDATCQAAECLVPGEHAGSVPLDEAQKATCYAQPGNMLNVAAP
jgi:hypothetical protein